MFTIKRFLAVFSVVCVLSSIFVGTATAATPTVPAGLTATPTNTAVNLSWTASSNVPTDYIIEYSSNAFASSYSRFFDAVSTNTTATVTGLTNGILYTFRVKATNNDGTSAASSTATATPYSDHTPNDLPWFDACPASIITPAGFTDINSADVSCIKYYGITKGTTDTTFSPLDSVTRWQMALFFTRMVVPAGATLPNGADQGFTDISGKSAEIQTAINQIKQLGITVGKTATTYDPDAYVTREEMAIFLERLLKAVVTGPGGNEEVVNAGYTLKEIKSLDTDHNFTDLSEAYLMEGQNAIVSLWNLGVAETAASTKYRPQVNISRLNMAEMMAKALDHTNARPSGITIQARSTRLAGNGATEVSVTYRTSDFLPIANALIDTFRYTRSTSIADSAFSSDGSCAQSVATEISVTACTIDATEAKTDVNGNLVTGTANYFVTGLVAGSITDYYAWTGSTSTTYDNDVHGSATATITIYG